MNVIAPLMAFLFGFIVAGFLSQTGLLLFSFVTVITIFAIAISIVKGQLFGILFITGSLWANAHHAPTWAEEDGQAQLVRSSQNINSIIVKSIATQNRYLVFGEGNPGELGWVSCSLSGCRWKPVEKSIKEPSVVRLFLEKRLAYHFDQPVLGFICGIILGSKKYLSRDVLKSFRHLGIYHLLIVSGLHLSILALIFENILNFPLRLIYVMGLIKPLFFQIMLVIVTILSLVIVINYGIFAGLQVSVQRSLLLHIVFRGSKLYFGKLPTMHAMVWAGTLQSVLFPLNLVCVGSLLSWGCYLLLVKNGMDSQSFFSTLRSQLFLTWLTVICFGSFSWIWPLACLLTAGCFRFLMMMGVFILVFPRSKVAGIFGQLHEFFLFFLIKVSKNVPPPEVLSFPIWSAVIFMGSVVLAKEALKLVYWREI